jgi:glutamine amidotransferase
VTGLAGAPKIAVIDYGIGNLRSAEKALQHVGADASLTASRAQIEAADAVVLPGVGAFGRCMEAIREVELDGVATEAAAAGTPFLGICVGMQMMFDRSEETPEASGLGILEGTVIALSDDVRRPQMQWNILDVVVEDALFAGIDDPWFYFVHSYAPERTASVIATCEYGGDVVAAVRQGNTVATQFHPEKSGDNGLTLLSNFVESISTT